MPPKKGALNKRGAARREEIVDAAIELFAARGYRGTSMLEIAKRVGMSHVGVLHHFGTKEELLRAVVALCEEKTNSLMRDSTSVRIEDVAVEDFMDRYVSGEGEFLEPVAYTRLIVVVRGENLHPGDPLYSHFDNRSQQTREFLAAGIRAGQKRGEFRRDIDPDIKAAEMLAFFMGLETEWALNEERIDRKAIFSSYMESLFAALKSPDRRPRTRQERQAASARKRSPSGPTAKRRGVTAGAARSTHSSKRSKN
jgi:AcrR family transcriptional regulator